MSHRSRIYLGSVLVAVLIVGGIAYHFWRTAGFKEAREITERIASLIARGDREAMLRDPLLIGKGQTVDWLLRNGSGLKQGYRISVLRNGDGHQVGERDYVSHLGEIHTARGTIILALWYDRPSSEFQLVSCGGFTMSISSEKPPDSGIILGPSNDKRNKE